MLEPTACKHHECFCRNVARVARGREPYCDRRFNPTLPHRKQIPPKGGLVANTCPYHWVAMASLGLVTNTKTARPARIGLATFTLIGALGLGWGGGLKLYDFLLPKRLGPPDMPALNAMVERLISNPSANNEQTQIGIPPRLFTFR